MTVYAQKKKRSKRERVRGPHHFSLLGILHRQPTSPSFTAYDAAVLPPFTALHTASTPSPLSSMPDNVVTNIMDRLPLKDAVRTSILSTSWRFKWTLLTRLILDVHFFVTLLNRKIHFDKTNISRLLLHLKGPITKFVLFIASAIKVDVEDIHHWVMFLSRIRGFKELTLDNRRETPVKLPTHLFSCLELKHLYLRNCVLFPKPYFCGFPKLLSLELLDVRFQDHRCGELITQCPLLETLKILNNKLRGEVKLVEIAKLENVKVLSLSLCLLDNMTMVRLSSVFHHMSLLPKLQELFLSFENCKFLAEDVPQNLLSTTFPFLKSLTLLEMDFSSDSMLSSAFGMLFGCANLETLHITAIYKNAVPLPAIFSPEVDCSTMGQLQLQNVVLKSIKGLENEVCLIKCMLAYSPMLKSIVIDSESIDGNEKYEFASKLLKLHRASPMSEIIF